MRDLKIGDEVVSDETGALTQFIGWMDLSRDKKTKMVEVKTDDGEQLTLTLTHILFYYEDDKPTSIYAKDLRPGNVLVGGSGEGKIIRSMNYVEKTGYLDPLTRSGTIVSNNMTASCYASFPHHLAEVALLPAKMFPGLLLDNQESLDREGTRTYVSFIKSVARAFGIGVNREDDAKEHGIYTCAFTALASLIMLKRGTKNNM